MSMGGTAGESSNGPGEVVVVSVTTPDEPVAEAISRRLVEERAAACAQVGGPIRSIYRWEGSIETDEEWTVTAKTSQERLEQVVALVRAMHPYEVPEIVAVPAVGGDRAYLDWVVTESS